MTNLGGIALGHTLQLPIRARYLLTQPQLEARIAVVLGGRASEDTVFDGVASTGASADLEACSEMTRQMVICAGT